MFSTLYQFSGRLFDAKAATIRHSFFKSSTSVKNVYRSVLSVAIPISNMDRDTGNNIFTALEVLIKIYPLYGDKVLKMLQDDGINPEINLV